MVGRIVGAASAAPGTCRVTAMVVPDIVRRGVLNAPIIADIVGGRVVDAAGHLGQ